MVTKFCVQKRFYKIIFKKLTVRYPGYNLENLGEGVVLELLRSYYGKKNVYCKRSVVLNKIETDIFTGKQSERKITYEVDFETPECFIEVKSEN